MVFSDNGDNHNQVETIEQMAERKAAGFAGATVQLSTLQMRDGQIAEQIDKANAQHLGVIQGFVNAVMDDKNYRQILKNAIWKNEHEARLAVRAISQCLYTGATQTLRTILDVITAKSSGVNGFLMHEAFEALTHTTFTSNHTDYSKRKNGNNSNSPIGK
jgi:hypothetical protein